MLRCKALVSSGNCRLAFREITGFGLPDYRDEALLCMSSSTTGQLDSREILLFPFLLQDYSYKEKIEHKTWVNSLFIGESQDLEHGFWLQNCFITVFEWFLFIVISFNCHGPSTPNAEHLLPIHSCSFPNIQLIYFSVKLFKNL